MITFNFAQTPITQIADAIIIDAARRGASDIHFDPRDNGLMVRIRIDGDLMDYAYIPKAYERNLITRIKLMSGMNITENRLPQDGAIKGNFGGINMDMRCSSLNTNNGEKLVIRILDYTRSLSGISNLGFNQENYEKLLKMITEPNGIILVTGATGSGKSTTVYSILQVLNKEKTNIITVEDPIEMNIEGLNQVQVNSEIGLTFATVLRSILRQDPNVILIGEIRDSETAKIAVRAAITGHLVLSTLHTNNSLSTIERLLDMDVEKYLLSSAINGIISQRLAKMICPRCRTKRKTTPYEKKVFKLALGKDIDEIYDANHKGCSECNNGYKGRIAIQEVLAIDDDIKNAINDGKDKEEIRKLVYGTGNVITLLQDGLEKILNGLTSFEEIYRIIEIDNDIDDSYIKAMNDAVVDQKHKELIKLENEELKKNKKIAEGSKTDVNKDVNSVIKITNIDNNDISDSNVKISNKSSSIIGKSLSPISKDNKKKTEVLSDIDQIKKKNKETPSKVRSTDNVLKSLEESLSNKDVKEKNDNNKNEDKPKEEKIDDTKELKSEKKVETLKLDNKKDVKPEVKEDIKKYSSDFYPKAKVENNTKEIKKDVKPEVKEDLKKYSSDFYPKAKVENNTKEIKKDVKPEVKEDLKKYSSDFYPKAKVENTTKEIKKDVKPEVKEDLKKYSSDFYPSINIKTNTVKTVADTKEDLKRYSKDYYPSNDLQYLKKKIETRNQNKEAEKNTNTFKLNSISIDIDKASNTKKKEKTTKIDDLIFMNKAS